MSPDRKPRQEAAEEKISGRPHPSETEAPTISAEDARQGEIILRTRRRRIIFLSGLVGFVVLVLVMRILA